MSVENRSYKKPDGSGGSYSAGDFHFPNVASPENLGQLIQPKKPGDGFRIPLIYFSWAALPAPRGLHLHPDADELAYFLTGQAEVGITFPNDEDYQEIKFDVSAGDVVLFPQGYPHYIKVKGQEETKFIAIFNNPVIDVIALE